MKRKSTYRYEIVLLALLMLSLRQAPADKITGKWILVSYTTGGETATPYQLMEFTDEGKILFRGFEMARYSYQHNKIRMQSSVEPSLNGEGHIQWQGHDRMQIILDSAVMDFMRWKEDYRLRPLAGVWIYYDDPEVYLKISDSATITEFVQTDYGTEMSMASGIYLPEEKKIIIQNPAGYFTGVYKVERENEQGMIFSRDGRDYDLIKDNETAPPPDLSFTYEDLPAEEDEGRLPWNGISWNDYDTSMVYYYQRRTYIDLLERFHIVNEMDRHKINRRNGTFCISQHLIKSHGKRPQIAENCKGRVAQSHNPFFPRPRPDRFRIVSTDTLYETPDFAFPCTLVEGVDGDKKFRYWMINNMPGVYARIIVQFPGDRDQEVYYIRELIEITKTDFKH